MPAEASSSSISKEKGESGFPRESWATSVELTDTEESRMQGFFLIPGLKHPLTWMFPSQFQGPTLLCEDLFICFIILLYDCGGS